MLVVGLSLLWPLPCRAQEPARVMSEPIARRLLASEKAEDQAWGAWMAGRLLMKDTGPRIERIIKIDLASKPPRRRTEVGLDALIEIGATPDLDLLIETRKNFPVQTLLLLSRSGPAAERVLLSMMAESTGYSWFAAANMLKARKAEGFAALLLKPVELTAQLVISRDGNTLSDGIAITGSVGDRDGGLAEGYPPATDYQFRSCDDVSRGVLAYGPLNVCYEKARAEAGHSPSLSVHDIGGPTTADRLAFFRQELSGIALAAVESRTGTWRGEAAAKAELAEVASTVRRKYAEAIDSLRQTGWLTRFEALTLAEPAIREVIVNAPMQ